VREYEVKPEALGLPREAESELAGGGPAENARTILEVLGRDRGGAARSATLLNAGAAIFVSGRVASLEEGVRAAEASLDSGSALDRLEALRAATGGRT
jgi:anthranilate phosphoribosyltransferase